MKSSEAEKMVHVQLSQFELFKGVKVKEEVVIYEIVMLFFLS